MCTFTGQDSDMSINEMYTFSTTKDDQDRVVIRVFEGRGKWTDQNEFLGRVVLSGIAPAPKGIPQIRVWLNTYGCGGFINLNVMDVASGRTNATIFTGEKRVDDHYGVNIDNDVIEGGAFEIDPAGKPTVLPTR